MERVGLYHGSARRAIGARRALSSARSAASARALRRPPRGRRAYTHNMPPKKKAQNKPQPRSIVKEDSDSFNPEREQLDEILVLHRF